MDLWIRSQYKMILVKVNQININYQNGRQIIANYTPDFIRKKCYEILGTYKSEERALEVLDEIQNAILGIIANEDVEMQGVKKYTGNALLSKCSSNIIYEMPKE